MSSPLTLSELKTLVQDFVENSETTFVNNLDNIIQNAEERIFELVQFDYFRRNVQGSMTAGSRFLTAPNDFELSFSLSVIDSNGDYHYLDKKHPSFMQEYAPDPTDSTARGRPLYYGDFDKNLNTGLLYGCLVEAYIFMKGDADMMKLYEDRFQQEMARLKNKAEARGRRDEYRYDSLRTQIT